MNILTITPNPAIDLTVTLEKLVPGEVHRAETARSKAGGKGINVSTNIAEYGMKTAASGFLGSANASMFETHFADTGIADRFLRVPGESRTNIKIVDAAGTTDVNLKGMPVTQRDADALVSHAEQLIAAEKSVAVLSGSLPPGCPSDFYRQLCAALKRHGCAVLLDADGDALKSALSGNPMPDCIKPNIRELSEWAGEELAGYEDIRRAAAKLLDRGLKLAVVSMGSDGALYISRSQCLHAKGKPERLASTVGAGDAMMAGIASFWAAEPETWEAHLEDLAKHSTAFSIVRLETGASGTGRGFRELAEETLHKIAVKRYGEDA